MNKENYFINMKRIAKALLMVLISISMVLVFQASAYAGTNAEIYGSGSGTKDNPYRGVKVDGKNWKYDFEGSNLDSHVLDSSGTYVKDGDFYYSTREKPAKTDYYDFSDDDPYLIYDLSLSCEVNKIAQLRRNRKDHINFWYKTDTYDWDWNGEDFKIWLQIDYSSSSGLISKTITYSWNDSSDIQSPDVEEIYLDDYDNLGTNIRNATGEESVPSAIEHGKCKITLTKLRCSTH